MDVFGAERNHNLVGGVPIMGVPAAEANLPAMGPTEPPDEGRHHTVDGGPSTMQINLLAANLRHPTDELPVVPEPAAALTTEAGSSRVHPAITQEADRLIKHWRKVETGKARLLPRILVGLGALATAASGAWIIYRAIH